MAIEGHKKDGAEEWEVVTDAAGEQSQEPGSSSDPFQGIAYGDYNSFAEELPACPESVSLASVLCFEEGIKEEDMPLSPVRQSARARAPMPGGTTGPGKAPSGAKAAGKKPTVASLATQLDVVLNSLPMITEQLTTLTLRQEAMEKKAAGDKAELAGFQMPTAGRAALPVSYLLSSVGPKTSVVGLGSLVGPPPKTKQVHTVALPIVDADLDGEPWDPRKRGRNCLPR